MTDTSPEIAEMVRARLMAKSGAERFRMGVEMFEAARRMVLASLPSDLSDTERKSRLFERLYGEALPIQTNGSSKETFHLSEAQSPYKATVWRKLSPGERLRRSWEMRSRLPNPRAVHDRKLFPKP